jgi:hypothetical protein
MFEVFENIDDLERCRCEHCGTVFYKTSDHFSPQFCSEECLDAFHDDIIRQSSLLVEILKLSRCPQSMNTRS